MPLSWNEIRNRAITFSREWAGARDERADAQTFWNELFAVYGVPRRRVATFESNVRKGSGAHGFIDLLWKKVVLVEHKSRGHDLSKAHDQARGYFPGLRDADLPRYIVVCDFERFRVEDLETGRSVEFTLKQLPNRVQALGFIAGYQAREFREQDPVNERAAEKLGQLHDELREVGYEGHELEVYLVRILFCLFAEDTGIFMPRDLFYDYIRERTSEDGSDLGPRLQELFETLNRPVERRFKSLDEHLQQFPYVNGRLFAENLPTAPFTSRTRDVLIDCCAVDWGQISPAIFGSLFQTIMTGDERRELGAHYTSEKNILKAIGPLFLDELRAEFESVKNQQARLQAFHERLGRLNFLDPACGCGNFLVIAYRELRLLELEVIRRLYGRDQGQAAIEGIRSYVKVDVDQFHGIEIEEWPAQIAQVAMWLIDHQLNVRVSQEFGDPLVRVPLVRSANIRCADALTTDWEAVVPAERCSFILGNPPFRGARVMSPEQKRSLAGALAGVPKANELDFVAGWYVKTARYMSPTAKAALVSTNSITQGVQVGILWSWMLAHGVSIHFAHRTFRWANEAPGRAAVHCVIIGFSRLAAPSPRRLFDYDSAGSEPHEVAAANINPYLVDADNVLLSSRRTPLSPSLPRMVFGSMANDDGALLINTPEERREILDSDPAARRYVRKFYQVDEWLEGQKRWCLWLVDADPADIRRILPIRNRVARCRQVRSESRRPETQALAATPSLFGEVRQPTGRYLLVPRHTGESRRYIPLGFLTPDIICGDANLMVPDATLYEFGVLSSLMHMAWVSAVCGRLESRYRYSASIVYNNFPWPEDVSDAQRRAVEAASQRVLDARAEHGSATISALYNPLSMPRDLVQAHTALDRSVDALYGRRAFRSDADRAAYLFGLYERITGGIQPARAPRRTRASSR